MYIDYICNLQFPSNWLKNACIYLQLVDVTRKEARITFVTKSLDIVIVWTTLKETDVISAHQDIIIFRTVTIVTAM